MIYKVEKYDINENVAYIISDVDALASVELGDKEKKYVHETLETKTFASVNLYDSRRFFVKLKKGKTIDEQRELVRNEGCKIADSLNALDCKSLAIVDLSGADMALVFAEGVELANYRFNKYLSEKKKVSLVEVKVCGDVCEKEVARLNSLVKGVFIARDIVNEPLSYMTAKKLAETIEEVGKSCGFKTEILDKKQ
ncbi:MAG: hypothetical protein II575_01665, partial [Bacteroidales bacterium]|nr:hypothetical protein [Bacteroidales bacterium]